MSQREAYQPPAGAGQSGLTYEPERRQTVTYVCGDCASDVTLDKDEKVRCMTCGYRILYKKRTKK